ncbi:RNA 2'-phosphotransferase [Herbidospora mongoliensis]|uniref:RNA 2'-phosphotransferase n=1 Tax=Herbidospora mongoliensis TaxID=688067 RepID=UPI0008316206|nr:RNA 2'-phosphotransferase [Herbidospora mongoliensis]
MDDKRMVRISKYLAKHLRHEPERIGLVLDENGWTPVDDLITAAAAHGFSFDRAELDHVVEANDKKRYVIHDGRIRASQGHSIEVDLDLPVVEPPDLLFHGTVASALDAIRVDGLQKMARHHVHLSVDVETASRVGARRGRPVILTIEAGSMHATGHEFRVSANGVWLVPSVPPGFIRFP